MSEDLVKKIASDDPKALSEIKLKLLEGLNVEFKLDEAVKERDLSKIKSDKDAYTDTTNIFIDKKNKLIQWTEYYGSDEKIKKDLNDKNKEVKKYEITKVLYMHDDKDNEYRTQVAKFK